MSLIGLDPISFFAGYTKDAHMIERTISESQNFKGERFPFKSPLLQSAFNEVRYARMFGGDCLRMIIHRENPHTNARFNPADYGAIFDGELHNLIVEGDELALIQDLKTNLRITLYALFDNEAQMMIDIQESLTQYLSEFIFYLDQFKAHLKKADQNLGLRLGEIYAEKSKI